MLSSLLPSLSPYLTFWPFLPPIFLLLHLLKNHYTNNLNRFPSPRFASLTNFWRFLDTLSRRTERTHLDLHRTHGDIVRLGPRVLSFADPRAIPSIYGLNRGMTKSAFYPVQSAVAKGKRLRSLFSARDEGYHSRYRRCVSGAFAMSALVGYEPLVDGAVDVFVQQTRERYVETGRTCDFSRWLQFFAFDVIGQLTWGKRLGFVERDEDVDGIVGFLGRFLSYAGPVGQMPWLDYVFEKNPVKLLMQKWGWSKTVFPVTKFALERAAEREGEMEKIRRDGIVDERKSQGVDMLMKFTQAQHDHPEFMTDEQVLASCTSMIFAGSETTAISLSSIFYYLIKTPRVYSKLMEELDEAVRNGSITEKDNAKVSWLESQKLPYLDAVIQEAFRVHPAAGLILERVVPSPGVEILDQFIPASTIVGCNPWVLHRRPEIFGEDVDTFRPERWLDASPRKLKEMKATMFHFGAGARTCIGKNISLLEIYKLVPTVLRNFELELDDPQSRWKTHNAWFVRQREFNVRLRPRKIAYSA